jgi:hypothetical protein
MQSAKNREMCYTAKDDYFKCLDKLPEDQEETCGPIKKIMEQMCPASWVSYFIKQREREMILTFQVEKSQSK